MSHLLAPTPQRPRDVDSDRGIVFKIADCTDEWRQAFNLIYQRYLAKELIDPNPYRCRVTPYHLRPQTNVFVAVREGKVISTATLIGDSPDGLPLEELYAEDIDLRRRAGLTLAEVSCFASRSGSVRESLVAFLGMMRVLAQHAQTFGIHELVAAAHPKHAEYYVRTMGFRYFGYETIYSTFGDAPAIGCAMNFAYAERTRPLYYEALLGNRLPLTDLLPRPMPPDVVTRFESMVHVSTDFIPIGL